METDTDIKIPSAPAILQRGRECWLWIVPSCPFCGKRHTHGGGPLDGDPREYLGGRASHCWLGDGGQYILTEATAAP